MLFVLKQYQINFVVFKLSAWFIVPLIFVLFIIPGIVYTQRYMKNSGIGTLAALMMPYSIAMLIGWTLFLLGYWALGIPLGIQAPYGYSMG